MITIGLAVAERPASVGQGPIANCTGLMTVGEKLREKIRTACLNLAKEQLMMIVGSFSEWQRATTGITRNEGAPLLVAGHVCRAS